MLPSARMRSVIRSLVQTRERALPPAWRNAVASVATAAMFAAAVWAWESSGLRLDDIRWTPVALSFVVAGPASIAMKAVGFVVSARLVDQHPSASRSIRVAIVSSAANILPLPGSLLVTVRSLAQDGSTYGQAIAASAVPGLSWIAFAGLVGGVAIGIEGTLWLSVLVVGIGLAATIAAGVVFSRVAPPDGRGLLLLQLIAAQAGWLLVSALRLGLAMNALGLDFQPARALALSVAGAATTAIGFVPGGLGVREGLIAALAPLVGLPVDTGVLIGTIDRVVWLAFLAVAAALLALAPSGGERRTPEPID